MYKNCCKKCGSTDLFLKESGNNIGLYCSDCGAWIKWINKDEKRAFEHSRNAEPEKYPRANEWIPVSEGLPKVICQPYGEPKEYIVQLIYGNEPTVGCLNPNGQWGYMDWSNMKFNMFTTEVIAWMSMPEAYQK